MLTVLVVVVGLSGALLFGAADFLGGLAAQRISSLRVAAIAAVAGLVVLLLAFPLVGGVWSAEALLHGGLSGISGAGAIVLLYACLAIGPMSILSPVTAVVSAIVPMTFGLINGERLETLGYVALGLALVAVVLVGFVPDKTAPRPPLRGLVMAASSGTLIGIFMVLIDMAPNDSGLVPLIANRAVNGFLVITAVLLVVVVSRSRRARSGARSAETSGLSSSRSERIETSLPLDASTMVVTTHSRNPWMAGLKLAIFCGVLDATANALLLLGLRLGELTIMSVLTAMYSAGTIILAAVVLKERLTPSQVVGLVLALVAAGMLAVG